MSCRQTDLLWLGSPAWPEGEKNGVLMLVFVNAYLSKSKEAREVKLMEVDSSLISWQMAVVSIDKHTNGAAVHYAPWQAVPFVYLPGMVKVASLGYKSWFLQNSQEIQLVFCLLCSQVLLLVAG